MTAVRYHPSITHLMKRFGTVGGNHVGVTHGFAVSMSDLPGEPWMPTMTAKMPHYERIVFDNPSMEMQYHLSGYGLTNEEAFVRLMGESVERYAAMVAMPGFAGELRRASFADLARGERVMPLDLLALYDWDQQRRMAALMHQYSPDHPTTDTELTWVRMASLVRPGEDVWLPAQLVFLGFKAGPGEGEMLYSPSFSTGTAAHVSTMRALRSALIEAIQIDAFIVNWYTDTPGRRVVVDDAGVEAHLERLRVGPSSNYRHLAVELTLPDLPLPVLGVFLERRDEKIPFITFGVQGDPDPVHAMIRGTMESAAITGLGIYSSLFDTGIVHKAVNDSRYLDLDTNVLFFASPVDAEEKRGAVRQRISGEVALSGLKRTAGGTVEDEVQWLVEMVRGVSEYAGYLDITPPELADTDWKVLRVVIPELCSMCLPGMPPLRHPRLLRHGGVTNEMPHPLP
ncbi:MAG: YcaO-like family protein [Actinomycetota bacterium]|jgi:thiazole/oxazole-forming peptide maturase SagD family component|nr:YcaO-like family protein [Actinomycetota bacterium]